MTPDWRAIPGLEGRYEVSSDGRVRSLSFRGRKGCVGELSFLVGKRGRRRVAVYYPGLGRPKNMIVARLMLMAFVGQPPFEGAMACHFDDDPSNDTLNNLRWDTAIGNCKDRSRLGTQSGDKNPRAKLSRVDVERVRSLRGKVTQQSLANEYGVDQTTISDVQLGRSWGLAMTADP